MKILIVEDEVLIQKSLKRLLERESAYVECTASGRTAIDMIKHNHYDRIVCDLMLNDITGFDVIEESKKVFKADQIGKTFVIISAYGSDHILEKAKLYGCPMIKKPFQSLRNTLDIILNKAGVNVGKT